MTLTPQQNEAMRLFYQFIADDKAQVYILTGYAGTGKTTLIAQMAQYLFDKSFSFKLMAPTGRAAKVLGNKIKIAQPTTIHKQIYSFDRFYNDENEGQFKYIYAIKENKEENIYIVDEASMISSRMNKAELFQFGTGVLLDDLLTNIRLHHGGKIIFVGDPMQLPPVGDNQSLALQPEYFQSLGLHTLHYTLTDVVRQHESSIILKNATQIRQSIDSGQKSTFSMERMSGQVMDVSKEQVASLFHSIHDETACIICYTNQQAAEYNRQIRQLRYPDAVHVMPDDKLMVVSNNYYQNTLLNGDIITVLEVNDKVVNQTAPVVTEKAGKKETVHVTLQFREITFMSDEQIPVKRYILETLLNSELPALTIDQFKALYINAIIRIKSQHTQSVTSEQLAKDLLVDPFFNAIQVKYGYAFTCHKAQGGEWHTVFVDFAKRTGMSQECLRWRYTAITRAISVLWCVNAIDLDNTVERTIQIRPIGKASKMPVNALALSDVPDTPYHGKEVLPSVRAKYWSVVNNMENTLYSVLSVQSYPWREVYEVETPHGIRRVDALYNRSGIFVSYQNVTSDPCLVSFFENESNVEYLIDYQPSLPALKALHDKMQILCDGLDIVITNIFQSAYSVAYYLKASGNFASITFSFNANGVISSATPLSDIGEMDVKLQQLLSEIN